MATDILDEEDFVDFENRRLRYNILWSFYENSTYRTNLHTWATAYRNQYALYKYIRSIYNPAHKLGAFWQSHLLGGILDPMAGDGTKVASAIPIVIPPENGRDQELRQAIAQVWEWSNWQSRKDIFTLYGTVMGDVALKVIDDVSRKKVYLEVVHPGIIKEVDLDPFGHIKGYTFEEARDHPERDNREVTYTETAEREGQNVVYKTYLNGELYPWDGEQSEWSEPYGFVPLVMVRHNDVGLN